jgi:hypothetical protein
LTYDADLHTIDDINGRLRVDFGMFDMLYLYLVLAPTRMLLDKAVLPGATPP